MDNVKTWKCFPTSVHEAKMNISDHDQMMMRSYVQKVNQTHYKKAKDDTLHKISYFRPLSDNIKVVTEKILEDVGIACNKNAIPYDPNPPKITSGLRFGTAAATSRGFNENDFIEIGNMITEVLDNINQSENNQKELIFSMKNKVTNMCKKYPIYKEAF